MAFYSWHQKPGVGSFCFTYYMETFYELLLKSLVIHLSVASSSPDKWFLSAIHALFKSLFSMRCIVINSTGGKWHVQFWGFLLSDFEVWLSDYLLNILCLRGMGMCCCIQRQLKIIYGSSVAVTYIWIFFILYNTWDCTGALQRKTTLNKIWTTYTDTTK